MFEEVKENETMKKVNLKNTQLEVPAIIAGCMRSRYKPGLPSRCRRGKVFFWVMKVTKS